MKLLNRLVNNDGVVSPFSHHWLAAFGAFLVSGLLIKIFGLGTLLFGALICLLWATVTYRADKRVNGGTNEKTD